MNDSVLNILTSQIRQENKISPDQYTPVYDPAVYLGPYRGFLQKQLTTTISRKKSPSYMFDSVLNMLM